MNNIESKILKKIKKFNKPITSTKLASSLKKSRQTIWRNLKSLENKNFINTILTNGRIHWQIKVFEDEINLFKKFEKDLKDWLKVLNHTFEIYNKNEKDMFEFITNIPTRRGYDRILIRGIDGAIELQEVFDLKKAKEKIKTDEAWLITQRVISKAAREETDKNVKKDCIYVYTFDELIDSVADFDKYYEWLNNEIISKKIDKYYIDLACKKPDFDNNGKQLGDSFYEIIDKYLDIWLDDPAKEHISLLGEFGTGKTWFCLHYAWLKLNEYIKAKKEGKKRPRLPIIIPLRDYAKAISVESLFSEFFFRKHEIPLPGYSAFKLLNRMGKFILIFDGFDEMARKVDYQTVVNNFWELAKIVVPGSKAILTCRTEHFRYSQESRKILSAEIKASISNIILEPPHFEVAYIEKLTNKQIKQLIINRCFQEMGEEVALNIAYKILEHPILLDLARRPVLIEFILDSLPEIGLIKDIDLVKIFFYSSKKKLERDILEERTFTSMADKVYFMCELAWEMIYKNEYSLNYKIFPQRIKEYFLNTIKEEELDHWHYDLMRQTLLIRDADGNYSFAHKSLSEFFVAFKHAAETGKLPNEFLDICRDKKCNTKLKPKEMTWSEYFGSNVNECPPLKSFKAESIEQLSKTFGKNPLSLEIKRFLKGMKAND